MRFESKSESEIAESNMIPEGEYPFEINSATEQTSKSGNEMVKLWVHIVDTEGKGHGIWDYLVAIDSMAYKLRHFAEATGMLPEYEQGEMTADSMVGCTGKCKVGIQPAKDGYPAKNTIKDYIKRTTPVPAKGAVTKPKAATDDLDDSIPF